MTLRRLSFVGWSLLVTLWVGCDSPDPIEPGYQPNMDPGRWSALSKSDGAVQAAPSQGSGPTVKAPSGTTAAAVSWNRIDISWKNNATSVSGFEVFRSTTGSDGPFTVLGAVSADVNRYGDLGLKLSTQYCYAIRALRTTGNKTTYSAFSAAACATTLGAPIPAAPTGADARPTMFGAVEVRWLDNSANEDGFRIERSTDQGSTWASVGTVAPNVTVFSDREVNSEQQVCYHVFAFNTFGESPSSVVDCTTHPAAVTNLTAAVVEGPAVDLTWTDNSSIEDGYQVRRAPWGHEPVAVATLPANSTSFHDADLSGNTTYLYCVGPTKGLGTGFFFCAIAVLASTSPAAPSTTSVMPSGSSVVDISWVDNSTTEEGFRVERSIDAGSSWVTAGTIGIDDTRFTDPERVSEQEVCYRVIAFNPAGDSPPSNTDCTIPPAGPTDLTAGLVDPGTVELTWTDNSASEEGYEVHYFFPFSEDTEVIAVLPPSTTVFRAVVRCTGVENFAVRARKDGGFSDFSNSAGVQTSWPCQ